mgnify:CR=1 FL=1
MPAISNRGPLQTINGLRGHLRGTMSRSCGGAARVGTSDHDAPGKPGSSGAITPDELQEIIPNLGGRAATLTLYLNIGLREAEVSHRLGTAMFIAQTAHESDDFKTLEEKGGTILFSKKNFPNAAQPDDLRHDYFFIMYDKDSPASNRRKVAATLGNTEPGDGKTFRGRGYIQLTGRSNYRNAGQALGLDLENHPDQAAQPANAARIAGWFWKKNKLNQFTYGDTPENFISLTKRINGGTVGLEHRVRLFVRAKHALGIQSRDIFDERLSSTTLWA